MIAVITADTANSIAIHEKFGFRHVGRYEAVGLQVRPLARHRASAAGALSVAVLTLMVGLPGSGKTTRARALAQATGALRLTPDEWQTRLFDDDMHHPDHDRRHGEIEVDHVGDCRPHAPPRRRCHPGFRALDPIGERRQFASRASTLGATCRVDFEPVPLDELERRIAERNRHAGPHFAIPIAVLRDWAALFEAPDEDELAGRFAL